MRSPKSMDLRFITTAEGNWYFLDDLISFTGVIESKLLPCIRAGGRRIVTEGGVRQVVVDAVSVIEVLVRLAAPDTELLIKNILYDSSSTFDNILSNRQTPVNEKAEIKHNRPAKGYCSEEAVRLVMDIVANNELSSQRGIMKHAPALSLATINRAIAVAGIFKDEFGLYDLPREVKSEIKSSKLEPNVSTSTAKPPVENARYFKYVPNSAVANTIRDIRSGKNSYKLQEIYQFMKEEDVEKANELYDAGLLV